MFLKILLLYNFESNKIVLILILNKLMPALSQGPKYHVNISINKLVLINLLPFLLYLLSHIFHSMFLNVAG